LGAQQDQNAIVAGDYVLRLLLEVLPTLEKALEERADGVAPPVDARLREIRVLAPLRVLVEHGERPLDVAPVERLVSVPNGLYVAVGDHLRQSSWAEALRAVPTSS
jgi:hypothetical protein